MDNVGYLKYGFHKENEPLTSWTLFSAIFFQISTESALIWKKTGEKSVQLVRGSFFRKYFLWNPYFNNVHVDKKREFWFF